MAQSFAVVFSAAALAMATAAWWENLRRKRAEEARLRIHRETLGEIRRRTWELERLHESLREIDTMLKSPARPAKCPQPLDCPCRVIAIGV